MLEFFFPSLARESTILENRIDDYMGFLDFIIDKFIYSLQFAGIFHILQQLLVIVLEGCGVRGHDFIEPQDFVNRLAFASLIVE